MSSDSSRGAERREAATELLDRLSKQRERLLNALAAVGEENRQPTQNRPIRRISRRHSTESQEGPTSAFDQEKIIKELSDGLQPEPWLRSLNLHQVILASLEEMMSQASPQPSGGEDKLLGETQGSLLDFLRHMTRDDAHKLVQSSMEGVTDALWGGITALQG
eukprot:CAMPEP_0181341390 /NCGR_PEP_ID=MMETSP1101-20121128/30387_1 /TAXON_ID=46948 /ORGANISM="Rhodomonas abbreviata, Strain Caron Lab Isolate" /LENGTH=162 /DNA_ID=CAMNT_0023452669 /DNA_START=342 /DNA_END=827 /DNA_ORIENTATION=+